MLIEHSLAASLHVATVCGVGCNPLSLFGIVDRPLLVHATVMMMVVGVDDGLYAQICHCRHCHCRCPATITPVTATIATITIILTFAAIIIVAATKVTAVIVVVATKCLGQHVPLGTSQGSHNPLHYHSRMIMRQAIVGAVTDIICTILVE
jgi:hypothetical protein